MTLVATNGPGEWWNPLGVMHYYLTSSTGFSFGTAHTMDAAGERCAMMGRVWIDGRPGSAKTISSAGGKIHWRAGAVTFADAGTSLDVGLQNVTSTAGPSMQPDGTFDVSGTLVGGTDTITANAVSATAMETGTMSVTHGDLVAVVLHMTARGGSDSVILSGLSNANAPGMPQINTYLSSWGTTAASFVPMAVIEFDDGTFGILDGCIPPLTTVAAEAYSDSTNPDERGLMFQVAQERKIDAIAFQVLHAVAASDFTIKLVSDPTGSPSDVFTFTGFGEWSSSSGGPRVLCITLPTEVTLAAGTNYGLVVKATSTSTVSIAVVTLSNANWRKFLPGGTTLNKLTRDGGTGAYTSASTTDLPIFCAFRSSAYHDGSGGGGGGPLIGGRLVA